MRRAQEVLSARILNDITSSIKHTLVDLRFLLDLIYSHKQHLGFIKTILECIKRVSLHNVIWQTVPDIHNSGTK